ncbi:ion channel [Fructilactobacillus vespulae]|uniref:ion channel n=1 Tax=Fructilactobacillus vespulae TaxID=1249630 RepID=UPI0039B62CAA
MKKIISNIYEFIIILLALISIAMVILDFSKMINIEKHPFSIIDQSIWLIFILDYGIGFILSKNKKDFITHHIFDLLAIIPVNSVFTIFKAFRITKLLKLNKLMKLSKLLRFIGVAGKLNRRIEKFLKTNGFIYILLVVISILVVASLLFSLSENISFDKSLWWSITTSTTVGYGDISPVTKIGKLIAIVLMLVGISFVGILTSTFTAYFTHEEENKRSNADEIRKFKSLLDDDIITKDEFEKKKNQLLNN